MNVTAFPLYSFSNGTLMIIIFGVVCLALVVALFMLMGGDRKKDDANEENKA